MGEQPSHPAVRELLILFDHVLEENGFEWDHWHSLLWNLNNVAAEEWDKAPAGCHRTIREMVIHIGESFLNYDSAAFGDDSRQWGDRAVDGVEPGDTPKDVVRWLRLAHGKLRGSIARLTDEDLDVRREAPWGERYETRRLIEIQIQHTLYHVGEINHVRALLQGNDVWNLDDIGREAT